MHEERSAESSHDPGAAAPVCGCVPHPERQAGVGVITGCACQGIEQVVRRTNQRSVTDVVKVIAFLVALVGLVVAIALLV